MPQHGVSVARVAINLARHFKLRAPTSCPREGHHIKTICFEVLAQSELWLGGLSTGKTLEYPIAVQLAICQSIALDKVKYNRWDELAKVLSDVTMKLQDQLGEGILEAHMRCTAELCLAKTAPRVGRNCRTPVELGDALHKLASVFANKDFLPEADVLSFQNLRAALEKVSEANLEVTQAAHDSLDALTDEKLTDESILFPLAQLNTFKELRRLCMKDTKHRLNELTKTQTLKTANDEFGKLTSGKSSAQDMKFVNALRHAANYVSLGVYI
jgi:hypothetical protein